MVVVPWMIDWLIPLMTHKISYELRRWRTRSYQNSDAGNVVVTGLEKGHFISEKVFSLQSDTYVKVIEPVNLVESVPPKVTSPFVAESALLGSKDTATRFCGMDPCEKRLSVTR